MMDKLLITAGFLLFLLIGCKQPKESPAQQSGEEQEDFKSSEQVPAHNEEASSEDSTSAVSESEVLRVDSEKIKVGEGDSLAYFNEQLFTGVATSHYANGEQATEIAYLNGMRDGVETRWYESGVKRFEGRFSKNQLVGVFEEWHPNGRLKSEAIWKDGKRVSIREWSETGEILRDN